MSDDSESLSHLDRASLRILASTTRASGGDKKVAERLDRAAGTGLRTDYSKAETSFNSLDPEKRRNIGTRAETKALTERSIRQQRKKSQSKSPLPIREKTDDDLNWQPIVVEEDEPEEDLLELTLDDTDVGAQAAEEEEELDFELEPDDEVDDEPAPVIPIKKKAALPLKKQAAPKKPAAKKKALDDPAENNWDWQKLPEDPLLKARKDKNKPLNPLDELRRQMLGGSGDGSW